MKLRYSRSTPKWAARAGALVLAGWLGMLAGCAATKPAEAPSMRRMPGEANLAPFFCLNAITPFHQKVSSDPAVREAVWTNLDKDLALATEIGATHVRIDMWWGIIEPEKGQFEWDFPDRVIDAIVAAGLKPYPILCYNSAWSPDASPATEEQRVDYGNYVYEMVKRYKDRVQLWEVWNEPNIRPFWVPTPDPELYAELLKVAYTRAKEADPDCTVVGFCTAGADYEFIEGGYRNGAKNYFDALSFHHYGDARDERQLEREIRRMRRILDRNGDAGKPIFITELGISTGPTPIAKIYSKEDQAVWMVKKHMVCIAEGVSQLYWFKMKDDATESNPDGYWGLVNNDMSWKPSGHAYQQMTSLLSDARFVGRAYRITEAASRENDVEVLLFQNREEVFACAWTRRDGGKVNIRLPATKSVKVEDLQGKPVLEAKPQGDGSVVIPVTNSPVYLRNLPLAAVPLASIHFDPNPVYLSPGEKDTVTMSIDNPLASPLEINLEDLLQPPTPGNLTIAAPNTVIEAPPKTLTRVTLSVGLPSDAKPFAAREFIFSDPLKYSYQLAVGYSEPFRIQMVVEGDGTRGKLTTFVTNLTSEPVSGTVHWKIRDQDVSIQQPVKDLQPGATVSMERKVGAAMREATLTAIVQTDAGVTGSNSLRVCGQPFIGKPPTIDGNLNEWHDRPGIQLTPEENLVRPEDARLSKNQFSGTVKLAWTKDHLFVAADIVDPKPMVNPFTGTELWRGDSMELYLGFDGPTLDTAYSDGEFQIGISPGDKGENPTVWNWHPPKQDDEAPPQGGAPIDDATVAVRQSEKGYRMEASIPLAALGVTVEPYKYVGFDVSLNNLNDRAQENNEAVLTWQGHGTGWKDPSTWGVAAILPGE